MSPLRVLVVDDDPAIQLGIRKSLSIREYEVEPVNRAVDVASTVERFEPDIIILDLLLPDGDGVEVCTMIRPSTDAAIIVLSGVQDEAIKVRALDAGADDYITKPFGMRELLARIRVAQRHRPVESRVPYLEAGAIRLDPWSYQVTVDGVLVHLTPTEFELLRLLLEQRGRLLTQRFILKSLWGIEDDARSHVLRTFVHQLRQKLRDVSEDAARLIETDPGVGYRISVRH